MNNPVAHINLLQRTTLPGLRVSSLLALVLGATFLGLFIVGRDELGKAAAASREKAALEQQIKAVQARLSAATGEEARNARAVALRKEVDLLQPQVSAAVAATAALKAAEGGLAEDFGKPLGVAVRLTEPGLWLTSLSLAERGKRLALEGQSQSGSAVLSYARKANAALQPLNMKLDSLEMQQAAGGAAGAAPAAAATPGGKAGPVTGAVQFRLQ